MIDRLIVLLLVANVAPVAIADDAPDKNKGRWVTDGWPLMQKFCADCHNADSQEGELNLDTFADLSSSESRSSMKRVLDMVRFGAMPPEDSDLPTDDERKKLVRLLEYALYSVSCDLTPRPGRVTARRMNRAEYNHTIRDLFGLDLKPAADFPSDEVGGGFDNNGDVLSLTPTMIEKYLDAAEYVASRVIIDPKSIIRLDTEIPAEQMAVVGKSQTGRFSGRFLDANSFVWFEINVPHPGSYRFKVRGGNSEKNHEPSRVGVYQTDGLLIGNGKLMYYGGGGSSVRFEFNAELKKGKQQIVVKASSEDTKLVNGKSRIDVNAKDIDGTRKQIGVPLKVAKSLDTKRFSFMIREVEINGPKRIPPEAYPPKQFEILKRQSYRANYVEPAARDCLKPLLRRAFRVNIDDADVEPYTRLVKEVTDRDESFTRGMQVAISAMLCSPRFLFRVESPPKDWKPKKGQVDQRLTDFQIATRLAYFIWSSTPDNSLLSEAQRSRIDKSLEYQVRRMIDDKRSDALATQFAAQWLGLRNLEVHEADTDHFKDFDPKLLSSMQRETEMLFIHSFRKNRPVAELLTADFTFVDKALAKHYGIKHSDGFQRVSLAGTKRRGILSHASVLTLTSNPNRTSPVKRGKWILQNILGTPPPDPPPGVPELEETKTASQHASLREQLELHRASATCASCHKVMDQLGFGLEQYDAIGRFRPDGVDATGVIPGGRKFDGALELSEMLSKTEQDAFAKTTIERLLTFAIGRELTPLDRCTVDEIADKTRKKGYRWKDLILEIAKSRPFQYYQLPNSG